MGYYIEVPEPKNKVAQFIARYPMAKRVEPGERIPWPSDLAEDQDGLALVCVVENPDLPFDATLVVTDDHELARAAVASDRRHKTWFVLDLERVAKAAHIERSLFNRLADTAPESMKRKMEEDPTLALVAADNTGPAKGSSGFQLLTGDDALAFLMGDG